MSTQEKELTKEEKAKILKYEKKIALSPLTLFLEAAKKTKKAS